jgi:hypothetical protein
LTYDNTNSGALFKTDNKKGDRDPHYKGTIDVGGVDHWINGWVRESKSGQKFMSLSIRPKAEAVVRQPHYREDFEPLN